MINEEDGGRRTEDGEHMRVHAVVFNFLLI
jgi:hypothetical protein